MPAKTSKLVLIFTVRQRSLGFVSYKFLGDDCYKLREITVHLELIFRKRPSLFCYCLALIQEDEGQNKVGLRIHKIYC